MAQARYKQVVDKLAAEIGRGRLLPGTRLPTHRQLAADEGLALVTASRVYAELEAMGLVSGETGRGTFVKETAVPRGQGVDQHAVAAGMLDLSFNYPALPGQAELLRGALRQLASAGDLEALLRYQPHGGRPHERASVARHLARRGLAVRGEQVMLVDGAQHGLATTVMALLQPGDVVAVDALTYPGFKLLAEAHRLELVAVPAGTEGPDPDALAALCRRRRVKALYAMPTMHNPLGWVMSASRRRALVAVVRRHGLVVIEDAAYAFLVEKAPPPLAALAPETTVYVSGFSKSVATGLRVGCVAAPPAWVGKIERAIRATTWNTPGVMTAITCGWLDDGTVDRLEAGKRRDARARQQLAAQVLGALRRVSHPASYFVWLPLAEEVRADQVAAALMRERISVSTAEPFATAAQVPHAIRLALGSVDLGTLRQALETVAAVIAARTF
ncbi:PLP-dependent aminotransferase family protein [Methylibium petroleiphilum]|uniref:aminotransferase-like domain-containing protein n=1 Tax=Methylibium petroleiphilum TaxID=105560 RepID=UPI001AC83160|nr:PLP-dependent aminotransferase family protein [Methylibium petroleiphilum]MBN9206004.1 PLP-dependent aminotransferase family protein [Methylibium petroleiphilum]